MSRIGIFGGSFNPPHKGHIEAVRAFQKALALDFVLLIPTSLPPHKQLSPNTPSAEERLHLTQLAARTLEKVEVSDIELRRNGASYTVDTLAALRERFVKDELFLLMGTDMLRSFLAWREPQRIAEQVTLCVASRYDDDRASLLSCAKVLQQKLNAKVELIDNAVLPVSSTSVRALLAFHCAEQYLDAAVYTEILSKKLYHTGERLKNLPFEQLSRVSLSLHKDSRVAHVIGCSQTAQALAAHYGANAEDARRAGILHDITKALTPQEQLLLCERYAILLSVFEKSCPKLLHAKTAAALADAVFGENGAVCEAIRWHTTGRANMSLLEKIIYLADYIEPNRDFEGVTTLREATWRSLEEGMRLGLEMTFAQLQQRGKEIDPCSQAALNYLKEGNN